MLAQYLCSKADSLIRNQGSVCIHIKCQLVIVSYLTNTGILHCHVYTLNGCIDRIDRNHSDGKIRILILICAHVASALRNRQLHVQLAVCAAVQMSDYKLRVQNLDVGICLNISCCDYALAIELDVGDFRFVAVACIPNGQILDVHDDLSYVFLYSRNGTELMQNAFDLHLADCCTR